MCRRYRRAIPATAQTKHDPTRTVKQPPASHPAGGGGGELVTPSVDRTSSPMSSKRSPMSRPILRALLAAPRAGVSGAEGVLG